METKLLLINYIQEYLIMLITEEEDMVVIEEVSDMIYDEIIKNQKLKSLLKL
tara:strand:+ start:586 stop:741 length:156 start_codon:yes stop_codon:yes gene_type:complete